MQSKSNTEMFATEFYQIESISIKLKLLQLIQKSIIFDYNDQSMMRNRNRIEICNNSKSFRISNNLVNLDRFLNLLSKTINERSLISFDQKHFAIKFNQNFLIKTNISLLDDNCRWFIHRLAKINVNKMLTKPQLD